MNFGKFLSESIQQRVLAVLFLLGLALVGGAYGVLTLFILPTFEALESEQNLESVARFDGVMDISLESQWRTNLEYSSWDDTYNFLLQPELRASYIEANMAVSYWSQIGTDFLLMFDTHGQLVWGQVLDPADSSFNPLVREQLLSELAPGHPLVSSGADGKGVRGIIDTPQWLALVVSSPVLRSDDSGPSPGVLVSGKFLSNARTARLAEQAVANVNIQRLSDPELPEQLRIVAEDLVATKAPALTETRAGFMISRKLIHDVLGNPVAIIENRAPRKISAIGTDVVNMALLFLTLSIFLFTFFTWLFLRVSILEPVSALRNHIIGIRKSGNLHAVFGSKRADEIGTLATEFDSLAFQLGETQSELETARDEAEASSRAKSEFLATMSHEIRTPLNGVIGMTEVLLRSGLAKRQQQLAETVRSSGRLLLNIINDILDFSKISASMMLIEKKSFTVRRLVDELNSVMAESAQEKGVEYLCVVDTAVPQFVVADDQRLRQVLINLIGNAIKFTRQGEVLFSVSVKAGNNNKSSDDATLEFKVSDTGIGIQKEAQNKIFESFSQADSGTTREFGGTGLGLAICKQLVEQMGGSIGVNSTYGEGSEFYFSLPVQIVEDASTEDTSHNTGHLRNLRILVVDDNATNREILTSHASLWQAHCDSAASAAEALQMLDETVAGGKRYDILLVDYHMPVVDGLSFSKSVWNEERYGKPSMLMLSSVADDFSAVDLQTHGIMRYLTKPVLERTLYQEICGALEDRAVGGAAASAPAPLAADADEQTPALLTDIDVLVAEDNRVNQELILILLEELGARVVLANHGREAIEQLEARAFDLVVMDCHMPVLDGFDATRQIRDRGFSAKGGWTLPILAMTANAMAGDERTCLEAGMDAYISKPFDYNDLIQVLGILLPDCPKQVAPQPELMPDRQVVCAALEREALEEIKAVQVGSTNLLGRLIEIYLETSPQLLEKITRGVSEQDPKNTELYAHSLKSSSARLGASTLATLCGELEMMGRLGTLEETSNTVLQNLKAEFKSVCHALKLELADA